MKIQSQLWLILSVLFLVMSLVVYLVVADAYEARLQTSYQQISFAQGSALLDELTKAYPDSRQRSSGYLQNYSEQLQARLILLTEQKKVFADGFAVLEANSALDLTVLKAGTGYASHFAQTEAFGYVQYTLLPFDKASSKGYLLIIQEAGGLSAELSSFRAWMLRLLVLALLSFFVLSYVVAAWLTKPMRRIIASLKQITPHKRDFALTYRRQDEIRELIAAIGRMVEELNLYDERQRRFVSTSSHELKTPLATIQLILENLPYVRENEETYQEFTEDLVFQVKKMRQIVEQLLQIMRLGDSPLQKETVSEEDIRQHLLQVFQYLVQEKELTWEFELQKTSFNVDRLLFLRALDNLVANAIRYSPQGKTIKIVVKGDKIASVVSVCDQGIGIAAADLPQIFEPFYRANDATAYNQEGSGLGLAIVKQIAELHQGKITVNSVPQEGSCFHFLLPT
ncbi:MAG TPA: HAMP domain-containing sensor histidine kinase [Oscillospiraceae bacterium]|nr:HAMP domain-containing sensor histidine kinase [Oscillospiraceae bacterium]